ncbi:hypothetical protein LTR28_008950 [Elasticomyces elasticus]|nr:hypothetical protein LTR28_008950 [Elasticomyces elasticus]
MRQRTFLDLKIDEQERRDLHVYAHTLLLNQAAIVKRLTEQYQNLRLSTEELGGALKTEKLDGDVLHRPFKHALTDNEEVKKVSKDMKFDDIKLGILEFSDERDGLKEDSLILAGKISKLRMKPKVAVQESGRETVKKA